jgi:tetratricopeptide (TPR) repeat protein
MFRRIIHMLNLVGLAILLFIGEMLILIKLYSVAEILLKLCQNIWPSRKAIILPQIGFLYERAGKFDLALEKYIEASELEPKEASHYWHMGFVYEKLEMVSLAIDCFEKTLKYDGHLSNEFRQKVQHKIKELIDMRKS